MRQYGFLAASLASLILLSACETRHHVVVEQPKPLEINVNLSGRLELVITDARKDVEQITGEKPKRVINPEDIGLPANALTPSSSGRPGAMAEPVATAVLLADFGVPTARPVAAEDDLKKSLAARNAAVTALLDAKVAGEAHTGLLVARGSLLAEQQNTLAAENADRAALYAAEAAKKKVSTDQVALAYFVARLGHVNKGTWYEKFNQASNAWEWAQMD